ncbi:MAG: metallophosphoesterase, partial [Pseudomonadota bacterium]
MLVGQGPAGSYGGAIILIIALMLTLLPGACANGATPAFATQAPVLRLGIIGDQTGTRNFEASYAELEKGVEQLKRYELNAVIHVGDLLESAKPVPMMTADFARASSILDRLDAPWFLTAGDHDVNPPKRVTGTDDRSREALFIDLYRKRNPAMSDRPYYSVEVDGWQLISLFSHDELHADPRWGNIFFARIADDQYAWLEATLAARRLDSSGTIVFIHQPLWYNWGDWARVHRLLATYGVRAVIAGHFHYSQDEGELDGIRYLIHGATGGRVKLTSPEYGGTHLVSVLTVSNDG